MKRYSSYLAICALVFCSAVQATEVVWQYPCKINGRSVLECDCWTGINETWTVGKVIIVDPERYLVGAPLSQKSAVTITTDKWIEVGFAGEITDGPDPDEPDLIIREMGTRGESALVLLSDGHEKTYALGIATANSYYTQEATVCEFDLRDVQPGFSPTAVRIMSLGLGGGSPGFDVASVEARITVQSPPPHLPLPGHKATDVLPSESLHWTGSGQASEVHLFLGQELSEVDPEEATPFASLPGDVNEYVPGIQWELGCTYYWRVVEIVSSSPAVQNVGEVWQFTVDRHHIVEGLEQYTEASFPYDWSSTYPVSTRSLAHCEESTYKGCHAAKLDYNLAGSDYAELTHIKDGGRSLRDWIQPGATTLELFFRNLPDNSGTPNLYVQVDDSRGEHMIVMYAEDPNHLNDGLWHPWRIDLTEFDTLDLNRVFSISIGVQFSNPNNTPAAGTLFIDQIQLCGPRHHSDLPLETDLNRDQAVTTADLALFADEWLSTDQEVLSVQEPNAPWCHLPFDSNSSDIRGNALTSSSGDVRWDGHADFGGSEASIKITNAQALNQFAQGITVSFWQSGRQSIHRADTLICSDYRYSEPGPELAPELAIGLGLWEDPEAFFWQCGKRQETNNLLTGIHQISEQWAEHWNHWAFTKDFATGHMAVYLNGKPLYSADGQAKSLSEIDTLELGNGWYSYYDGLMDDFRIHDYALNAQQCAYLATNGTGIFPHPAIMPSDFNQDGQVDWQDFAALAEEWIDGKN